MSETKNKGFFSKLGDTIENLFKDEEVKMPQLDNEKKKYTDQDLFEATQEAFQKGYATNSDYSVSDHRHITRPLNTHKRWFLDFHQSPNFKNQK